MKALLIIIIFGGGIYREPAISVTPMPSMQACQEAAIQAEIRLYPRTGPAPSSMRIECAPVQK